MFPFPISFCPESVRRRVLDLFPQGYVCYFGCAKTITSAWHNCFLSRKRLLHRYGTTVTSVCNRSQATSRMFRNRHRTCLDHRCHTVPVYSKCFFARSVREAVRLCALDSMFCARNGSRACWQLLAFAGRASAPASR